MANGNRPSRNLQRRIRVRQQRTGERYMISAQAIRTELALGRRYLADPTVPADLAAAVREAGLIPLEPLNVDWDWWCRCSRCEEVIAVYPRHHGYPWAWRSPYHMHECSTTPDQEFDALMDEFAAEIGDYVPDAWTL